VAKSKKSAGEAEVKVDRRRNWRRTADDPPSAASEVPKTERRKVQRRRQIDPTTCERDYSNDEIEFMQALDAYKRSSGRMFPTCSEILEVVRGLGYQRVSEPLETPADMAEAQETWPTEVAGEPQDADVDTALDTVLSATEDWDG
jgi:hypothetical protein